MPDQQKLLSFEDLAAKGWTFSAFHTRKLVQQGKFPKPFKFSPGRSSRNFWLEADIDEFLANLSRQPKKSSAR